MFDIAGRHALVTGGANGIGAGIASALMEAGCHVTVADLPGSATPELEAAQSAGKASFVPLDVTDEAGIAAVVGALNRLDILVNCAGIIRRAEEFDLATFARVLDVNLTGTMRLCTACRPLLAANGPDGGAAIVNIASMLSFFGGGLVPAYSASKGGIAQLTKSLAIAWAKDGIRVNAVAPGWIATPLTRALQEDPERSKAILSRTPMGRWGKPSDVAGATLFLCSPAASFMTGVVLPVDGGYLVA
ncbi:SDR family oxidoreductase [Azospirillum sp. SYSU D00513]|uniref:SDR family NAD(P)-dependent oxidoreductase n=1 Tax=Azospirillum sp. SYSU D00513 TaxID=2812561 RepID=UPI001A97356A|nr:SDR family oxidoreductase [Azospirillum sp. SYSU D00513]